MGYSVTDKILNEHQVSGPPDRDGQKPGAEIGIRIDQTLTQDATGTMVYLQFEALGIPQIRTELSVSYVDHNTQQTDYRNMDDHRFLQSAARKWGLYFSRPGNGICHQVHLERFGAPGKTLLGSDSHTPTAGGLGMLAIGAGGLDVAAAMAGAPFSLSRPRVVGVRLTGELPPLCNGKDVILTLLRRETVKGGVGRVYEYLGPGVASLSVPQRATITNMGAELGATTSIFPSDDNTRRFLALQGREEQWRELTADPDAAYDEIIELDLSAIEPMAAMPHMPDRVVPVRELGSIPVEQVVIGSCTNSSINDLGIAAELLEGRTVAQETSLGIAPGSRQVLEAAMRAGILTTFVSSGARVLESACGPCIGMGFAPSSGAVSLRTFNRNFRGRSGTADAQVYLVSPETAAASAVQGAITDPRELGQQPSGRDYTSYLQINDNMILPPLPPEDAQQVELLRGPNIKPCPAGSPLGESLRAEVLLVTGDNITTDDIMPAGSRILPLRSNIPEIAKYVFESVDPGFYDRAMKAGGGVVVGGENYGQGSSREHAALAPMYLGVRAVVARSFARIHKANLINFGILPLTFTDPGDYELCTTGAVLRIEGLRAALQRSSDGGGHIEAVLETGGGERELTLQHDLAGRSVELILAGGLLAHTRKQAAEQ
jgi:aconitate hydratase